VFPMTLLMLTMTSSLERFTANKTSVSQLRIACLLPTAVVLDVAAAVATRLSGELAACVPVLDVDTNTQNIFIIIHRHSK